MDERAGQSDLSVTIDAVLRRSFEWHEAMARTLDMGDLNAALIDTPGTDVALTSASLSWEHADSCLTLMARGNPTTATAALRMQFECMVRGAWAIHAAREDELDVLQEELSLDADDKARNVGRYGDMLKALRKQSCNAPTLLVDEIGRIDQVLRTGLNSFVHGGFQPLKRHGGFPLPLAIQVIQTSNGIASMAAALLAVLVADEGKRMSRLNALIPQFRDVLPELTIVQRHA